MSPIQLRDFPLDVLPILPAPADWEHPPGSSDEDESDDEKEEAGSEGERLPRDVSEKAIYSGHRQRARRWRGFLTTLNSWQIFPGKLSAYGPHCSTINSSSKSIDYTAAECELVQGDHQATGLSAHKPPLRLQNFLDSDGSIRSVKLPLAKFSVDGASAEGSWALLMRCEGAPGLTSWRARRRSRTRTRRKRNRGKVGMVGASPEMRQESGKDGGEVWGRFWCPCS